MVTSSPPTYLPIVLLFYRSVALIYATSVTETGKEQYLAHVNNHCLTHFKGLDAMTAKKGCQDERKMRVKCGEEVSTQ